MANLLQAALVGTTNRKYYFFRQDRYVRYTGGRGVDDNYPQTIDWGWNGLWTDFPGPYDCAVRRSGNSKHYYFFKGRDYARYTWGRGVDDDYPKPIGPNWHDLARRFPPPYDAAVVGTRNGKYYFFKGDEYVRYTGGVGVDAGYPKKVNRGWHSLWNDFPGPYDAVIPRADKKKFDYYFFRDGDYVRYSSGVGVDAGYPKSTAYQWMGLWSLGDAMEPTLGSSDDAGPRIWLWQSKDEPVKLVRPAAGLSLREVSRNTHAQLPGLTKVLRVHGLSHGTTRAIRLQTAARRVERLQVRRAPDESSSASVTFVLGSCLDDARRNPDTIQALASIAALNPLPAFMLWAGDNSYYVNRNSTSKSDVLLGDMRSEWAMFLRHFTTRSHPHVARLLRTVPAITTWDDHDFGFNNATATEMGHRLRAWSSRVFRAVWPNAFTASGSIESSFRWGGVHVFLTDGRYFRRRGQILGPRQRRELKNALYASPAPVKVVVTSSQFLPSRRVGDNFSRIAGDERRRLIKMLRGVSGRVLILSGDIHSSELTIEGDNLDAPNLVELTSSPLLLKSTEQTNPKKDDSDRVWAVKGEGFAKITVSFDRNRRPRLLFECLTASGEPATAIPGRKGQDVSWVSASAVWTEDGRLTPAAAAQ